MSRSVLGTRKPLWMDVGAIFRVWNTRRASSIGWVYGQDAGSSGSRQSDVDRSWLSTTMDMVAAESPFAGAVPTMFLISYWQPRFLRNYRSFKYLNLQIIIKFSKKSPLFEMIVISLLQKHIIIRIETIMGILGIILISLSLSAWKRISLYRNGNKGFWFLRAQPKSILTEVYWTVDKRPQNNILLRNRRLCSFRPPLWPTSPREPRGTPRILAFLYTSQLD